VLSGTPAQAGISRFSIGVVDAARASASREFTVTIASPIIFSTNSLPDATAGTPYNQSIVVTGGTPPYTFVIDSGSLPPGITLNSAGGLFGTPTAIGTFAFTLRASDTFQGAKPQASATQAFQLTVVAPPRPAASVAGVNDTEPPAQQPALTVKLAKPYPLPLDGAITLTFASAVGNVDDPAIQFSTGGRTAAFTIPAGTTAAVFSNATLALSTGTVAGKITLTLSLQASGQDVTPQPAPTRVVTLPAQAPVITTNVTAKRTGSGLEVDITGFSNSRDMTSAAFQFQAAAGTNLQTSQVTIPVDQIFATWYNDAASQPFGSGFLYAQQFTITGNAAGITGVTVTLTNKQGTSSTANATVQ
jgi:hypothetical protein